MKNDHCEGANRTAHTPSAMITVRASGFTSRSVRTRGVSSPALIAQGGSACFRFSPRKCRVVSSSRRCLATASYLLGKWLSPRPAFLIACLDRSVFRDEGLRAFSHRLPISRAGRSTMFTDTTFFYLPCLLRERLLAREQKNCVAPPSATFRRGSWQR